MEKSDQDSIGQADDILVVDDSNTSLQLLTEILTKEGYQVRPAERPQLAIESALAHPPSLILLDLKMLGVNGIEVCRRLKQDGRTREVPIIFLNALQDVRDRIHGFEAGGVDFINKPYQELEVLARVKTHLKLRDLQLHLEDLVSERTAEFKQAYASISKSEERFKATFEQAAVGIAQVDQDGRFLHINQRFCDIVGYSQDEMLERTFQDITHPDDLDTDLDHVRQVLTGKVDTYSIEKRCFRKNGEIVWANLTVSLLREDTGEPRWFVAIVEDITERKRAEESLRRREAILQAVAYAAEHFLKVPSWEDDVDLVLAQLGQAAGASRVYVFENHTDAAGELLASQRYEWV
ncbi:MAG: PAS domain S-box protein, partial [Desulfobacteraceae bacterium]|nr:PAS domain S-box protein [Desulfobacteraceae bacterium]